MVANNKGKRFQTPATLSGITTKTDGSLSLRFSTQEMGTDDIQTLLEYRNSFGWLLFQEQAFKSEEELQLEDIRKDTQGKSPSQRLRSVIFLLWKQSNRADFDTFYGEYMEKIINQLKDKLPDREG